MQEFIDYILGGMTSAKFAAAFVFSLLGVFLSLLIGTTKRDPNSDRSPYHFSWNFLLSDNAKRIYKSVATTLLVIFISIRFAKELFGTELSMVYAFGVGLGLDQVIFFLKQRAQTVRSAKN